MPLTLDEFSPADYAEWKAAAEESLKGAPFDKKLLTRTHEGITLQPIYNSVEEDTAGTWPGFAPFGRGASAAPQRPLTAQELPFGTPRQFNEAVLSDLPRGQNALAIQVDVATRRGVDPSEADTPEVAACGLSLASLEDLKTALAGVDPTTKIFLWAGASALPLTGLLAAHPQPWQGGVLGDPLTEYARVGNLPMALDDAFTEMAACVSWSALREQPLLTVGVGANFWADAGGSAVEELAFAMATAVESLRELASRDVPVATAAAQVLFTFSLGSHVFMEIAKIRAARVLWNAILEAWGVEGCPAKIHGRSSMFNKSSLDPHTNMLRTTAEGFIGYMAGVDSMHLAPFDDTIRTPAEFSRRIARNVHTILAEECDFVATADAAGGSYYVETLTTELTKKAWALFQEVEKKGGMTAVLRTGFPQEAIGKVAASKLQAAALRRDSYIGVNLFPNAAEQPLEGGNGHDARAIHAERAAFIESIRPHSHPKTGRSVEAVRDAFESGATLGQVCESLPRSAACEQEIARIRVARAAEGYEVLRARAWNHKKLHGAAPLAWLANFGPVKQHKARADFSAGFLSAGGFQVQQGPGAKTPADAVKDAVKSGAQLVVICSTDDTYPEIVPDFAKALRSARPDVQILLAGNPLEHAEAFKAAGVNDFLHIRSNLLELLGNLQKTLGIGH